MNEIFPLPRRSPKVFLSYSHDSLEHKNLVLALCNRLRADGIEAWIDQYEISPPEGWPRWCARRIQEADFVLVICTQTYERRFHGNEDPSRGQGTQWEGYVAIQELYEAGARNTKFIPVLFPPATKEQIPVVLRSSTYYDVSSDEGYWRLVRHLTSQPEIAPPTLGELVSLMPRSDVRSTIFPEPQYKDERTRQLGEELAFARRQLKEQTIAGQDTKEVCEKILRIRREMREGGRLQPGDWLSEGRFQLIDILGHGGFATVWKAWDEDKQRLVAVKVLHGVHTEDRSRRERFFRGARKMAELHHPGIVRVVEEHLEESGHHYFVMEYVEGGDLRQAVLAGKLRQRDILPLILDIGESLAFAHDKGVIHRDVKPANILLEGQRPKLTPKLTDFDLVRAFDTTGGTQTRAYFGTFFYTAPEVMESAKDAGIGADIYSLAMTTIFAFHGKDLPLQVWRSPEIFIERLPCSPVIQNTLRRSIAWEVDERPNSIRDFCHALNQDPPFKISKGRSNRKPQAGEELAHKKDGSVLVYVPGGEYSLGAEDLAEDALPLHRVILSPFWIGKNPVTNSQYSLFMRANPEVKEPKFWNDERFNQPQQPVVGVSWDDAQAYCTWVGLQLPTEVQWEAAARGTHRRRFPWGQEEPTQTHANFGKLHGQTTPVGTYPQGEGPYGTLDQAGNVWEWCRDAWVETNYQKRDGKRDLITTTADPGIRCLRGGSWTSSVNTLAAAFRSKDRASSRLETIGFRCLLSARTDSWMSELINTQDIEVKDPAEHPLDLPRFNNNLNQPGTSSPAASPSLIPDDTAKIVVNTDEESAGDPALILVVDDVDHGREIFSEYLEFRGFRVASAADGLEALEKAFALIPDVILMDLSLPGIDGWEATRRLKQDERTRQIPVIAVTAHALAAAHDKAREVGCVSVITKPLLPKDLEMEIRKNLKGKHRNHNSRRS